MLAPAWTISFVVLIGTACCLVVFLPVLSFDRGGDRHHDHANGSNNPPLLTPAPAPVPVMLRGFNGARGGKQEEEEQWVLPELGEHNRPSSSSPDPEAREKEDPKKDQPNGGGATTARATTSGGVSAHNGHTHLRGRRLPGYKRVGDKTINAAGRRTYGGNGSRYQYNFNAWARQNNRERYRSSNGFGGGGGFGGGRGISSWNGGGGGRTSSSSWWGGGGGGRGYSNNNNNGWYYNGWIDEDDDDDYYNWWGYPALDNAFGTNGRRNCPSDSSSSDSRDNGLGPFWNGNWNCARYRNPRSNRFSFFEPDSDESSSSEDDESSSEDADESEDE